MQYTALNYIEITLTRMLDHDSCDLIIRLGLSITLTCMLFMTELISYQKNMKLYLLYNLAIFFQVMKNMPASKEASRYFCLAFYASIWSSSTKISIIVLHDTFHIKEMKQKLHIVRVQ